MLFEKRSKTRPAAGGGIGSAPSSALNRLSGAPLRQQQRTLPGGKRYRCTPTLAVATAVLALVSVAQLRGYGGVGVMDEAAAGVKGTAAAIVDGGPPPSTSTTTSYTRGNAERIETEVVNAGGGVEGGPHPIPGPPGDAAVQEATEGGSPASASESPPSGDGDAVAPVDSPASSGDAAAPASHADDQDASLDELTSDGGDADAAGAGGGEGGADDPPSLDGEEGDASTSVVAAAAAASDEPQTETDGAAAEPQVPEEGAVVIDDAATGIVAAPKPTTTVKIEQISILGERNSGTRWTVSHVGKCFNHTLAVRERLVRHKHWFQDDTPLNTRFPRVGTLVIAQFRNPYHWVEAMRAVPHHAPMHYKLGWKEYVTTPWTMPRLPSDLAILKGNLTKLGRGETEIECQEYFTYNQITSCQVRPYPPTHFKKKPPFSGHQPQYELRNDGSGMPYGSVLDLRADKIRNHLSVAEWDWVQDLYSVRYEELLANGTAAMIRHIEDVTGVKATCDPYPPQNRPKRPLGRDYVEWMTKFVDWEAEALVGYEPLKEGAGGAVKAKTKRAVKK